MSLGILLNTKNDWSRKIGTRITKADRVLFALLEFFKSRVFSKRTKLRIVHVNNEAGVIYGCEVRATTSVTQRRLKTFGKKKYEERYAARSGIEDQLMA